MKRWFNSYTFLSVLLSVLVLGAVYDSHAACGDPASDSAMGQTSGMFAALGLTDAQKAQIKDILAKYRPTLRPLVSQFRAQRQELRRLTYATPVDDAAIRAQAANVSSIGADLAVQRAHMIQDVRSLLTPQQIQEQQLMTM